MSHKLDKIDEQIIRLLQEDGRMPAVEIARRLDNGITERMVRFRLKKMQQDGVIRISAVLNAEKVGYPVTADVWVEVEGGQVMEIARQLAQLPQVCYVALSTGEIDISLQVRARDNLELHHIVTNHISTVPGVKKATMVILPRILMDIHEWRIPLNATEQSQP
ncbi:MAG: Lrp/AsnC family transcriptional regulator [Anaerolineae bacterium]|nr:Lrp/AsnC family transcriptional regulator [Anaerolineae bacterium]